MWHTNVSVSLMHCTIAFAYALAMHNFIGTIFVSLNAHLIHSERRLIFIHVCSSIPFQITHEKPMEKNVLKIAFFVSFLSQLMKILNCWLISMVLTKPLTEFKISSKIWFGSYFHVLRQFSFALGWLILVLVVQTRRENNRKIAVLDKKIVAIRII